MSEDVWRESFDSFARQHVGEPLTRDAEREVTFLRAILQLPVAQEHATAFELGRRLDASVLACAGGFTSLGCADPDGELRPTMYLAPAWSVM